MPPPTSGIRLVIDQREVLSADPRRQVGDHFLGDAPVQVGVEHRCGGDRHRRGRQRALGDPPGDLLAAQQAHHQCGADPVVVEVVAAQMGDRGDHPDLDHGDAGDIGRDRDRQRRQPTDVGDETLRRGEADMGVDQGLDGQSTDPPWR